jgi:very-short-patch-repair endonuclease
MATKQVRIRGKMPATVVDEIRWTQLRAEYDDEKNELLFDSYAPKSNKKVWWKCPKGHSYDSAVVNRYSGTGCSYCSGRKVNETNCIAATHPEIAARYHPEKNSLEITAVSSGMNAKCWWKCERNHEWQAAPNTLTKRTSDTSGCPHCVGNTTAEGNTLAEKYPMIASEWHPTKNGFISPSTVTPKSDKMVWWICVNNPAHSYQSKISNRTTNETGCSYCAGKKVCEDNSCATHHPALAAEWHPTKNEGSPDTYSKHSGRTVWWKCVAKGHEWKSALSNRIKGHGCPSCSGRIATADTNLAVLHPHLLAEWDFTRNERKPDTYTPASHEYVWWRCSKNSTHTWVARISNRTTGNNTNCPTCSMSKLELETVRVLTALNIAFDTQKIFPDMPQYRYDFFVPSLLTLIECDGIQHFDGSSRFYTARTNAKSFEAQQSSDKEKDAYALANGYSMLRIGYTELQRIDAILRAYIEMDRTIPVRACYPPKLYVSEQIPHHKDIESTISHV